MDEALGLAPRMRFSPDVGALVARVATHPGMTYELTSYVVERLTPISMSKQTVKRLVDKAGEAVAEGDKELLEAMFEQGKVPEAPKVPCLFVEADGLYVKGRRRSIEIKNGVCYVETKINFLKKINRKFPSCTVGGYHVGLDTRPPMGAGARPTKPIYPSFLSPPSGRNNPAFFFSLTR